MSISIQFVLCVILELYLVCFYNSDVALGHEQELHVSMAKQIKLHSSSHTGSSKSKAHIWSH